MARQSEGAGGFTPFSHEFMDDPNLNDESKVTGLMIVRIAYREPPFDGLMRLSNGELGKRRGGRTAQQIARDIKALCETGRFKQLMRSPYHREAIEVCFDRFGGAAVGGRDEDRPQAVKNDGPADSPSKMMGQPIKNDGLTEIDLSSETGGQPIKNDGLDDQSSPSKMMGKAHQKRRASPSKLMGQPIKIDGPAHQKRGAAYIGEFREGEIESSKTSTGAVGVVAAALSGGGGDHPVSIPIRPIAEAEAEAGVIDISGEDDGPRSPFDELRAYVALSVDEEEKVESALPGWYQAVLKVARTDELACEWLMDAINRSLAKADPDKPGHVAAYAWGCLSRWTAAGGRPHVELEEVSRRKLDRALAEEAEIQQSAKAEAEARKKAEAEALKAQEERLQALWDKLSEGEQAEIKAAVRGDNPGLGRWKNMLMPLCLAELDRRSSADPPAEPPPRRARPAPRPAGAMSP